MPPFPSLEWMQSYAETLAAHPQGAVMAAALDGRYRFVIEPGGPVLEEHAYEITIGLRDGEAQVEATEAGNGPVALEIVAAYPRWRELCEGKLDLLMAMLLRRIKVNGDLGRLRSRLSDARPLLDSLHDVPTQWPG